MATRPVLEEGNQEYLDAFNFLDRSREVYEGGVQAISIGEVLAFCTLTNIPPGEDALKLLRIMQELDSARIKHWYKKNSPP